MGEISFWGEWGVWDWVKMRGLDGVKMGFRWCENEVFGWGRDRLGMRFE